MEGPSTHQLDLDLHAERFAVVRLDADAEPPGWLRAGSFHSLTRRGDELSIVCEESGLPPEAASWPGLRDLRCLTVRGPLDFAQTGILESLARPLALAGVSIFALSTYDTDIILVEDSMLARARAALADAGHRIHG